MHYHFINNGIIVDAVPFCSDACHREWCHRTGAEYGGWNGCHEGGDTVEFCANCGVVAGGAYECDCQRDNVVVNRFRGEERCKHRNFIQILIRED